MPKTNWCPFTHPSKHKFIVEDERWNKNSPSFPPFPTAYPPFMSSCAFQQSPFPEKLLKNTIQRHLFELTSTPIRCFREPFCILTMGRQKITSSQEHISIFTHRLRAYSWFAALPNMRAIIVNMKSATGMKPSWSYFSWGKQNFRYAESVPLTHHEAAAHTSHWDEWSQASHYLLRAWSSVSLWDMEFMHAFIQPLAWSSISISLPLFNRHCDC